MSRNKLRVIIITIIIVFLVGLVGLSIRMALQPEVLDEKRTEAISVLQSGFTCTSWNLSQTSSISSLYS
ncbi:hypothetical protein SAMN05421677_11984 [Halobacillus aidingensis]|uniref:Uncharacterized protein n=1 Tax=Halobacillus aidingensis TaxID=240303 RepID=A0A1H0SZQ9_HALAD|nr:hypothetical protein SAMN05421677_11984 [Halobacillus aidingensis]